MATRKVDKHNMTNNKQLSVVDSIIEFCQKQMDNDSSIHKGVYLSIIKFCEEQAKEMEKERMKGMYVEGSFAKMRYYDGLEYIDADQYYEQTYEGGEQ